jgi:hypothetical protein
VTRFRQLGRGAPSRRSDEKPYAVLDVETDGLRGPILAWAAGCECDERTTYGRTEAELWRHVLGSWHRDHRGRDHVWFAHNGGEYDYVYLFGQARAAAISGAAVVSPIVRAEQMIGFRITAAKHRTDLRDSMALLPASLRALADQLAPDLPKLDIGLASGVTFDLERPDHRAYLERDVRSLLAVLIRFRAILHDQFDGTFPSWSAASTALRAWSLTIPDGVTYSRASAHGAGYARAGYYGGMVHPTSTAWHSDVVTVDVNSMYPWAMREHGVPVGWGARTDRYIPGRPGFYIVDADVDRDTPFPFLPYRDPAGVIAWPTGRFASCVTSVELEAARARGMRLDVRSGVVFDQVAYPFGTFVDRVERLRREGGAVSYVGKIMANSLYGKFGSKPLRDEWMIAAEAPGPDWFPPASGDPESSLAVDGLWRRSGVPLREPYLLPHWAAWITAQARLRLVELVEAIGERAVLYTDTDSVTAPRAAVEAAVRAGRITVGPAFGDVKLEHEYERFRVIAPKVTEGYEASGRVVRAKGIPRDLRAAAIDGVTAEWDSPNAAIQVLRGAPMTTRRTRRVSALANSVAWRGADDGTVRPVHLGCSVVPA